MGLRCIRSLRECLIADVNARELSCDGAIGHRGEHWRGCVLVAVNAPRKAPRDKKPRSHYCFWMHFVIALLLVFAPIDREYLASWEATQKSQPRTLQSTARIAPLDEPGTPLTIRGRVVDEQGRAIRDAVVFAYHTDRNGVYDHPDRPAHSWRLRGWAKSDERGTFVFETIRPAPYPNRNVPAHVHFSVVRSNGLRYLPDDLNFDERVQSPAAEVTLTLREAQRF